MIVELIMHLSWRILLKFRISIDLEDRIDRKDRKSSRNLLLYRDYFRLEICI